MNKHNLAKVFVSLLVTFVFMVAPAIAKEIWPDLPVGIKNGVSAQVDGKLFVGLGSVGTDLYMLDLKDMKKGWQKRANFIGPVRDGATASVIGDNIYVFGGSGKNKISDPSPILFTSVYRYNVSSNKWSKLETTAPIGLLGAVSYSPNNHQIVLFGGYNKAYFDKYFVDISATDKTLHAKAWNKIVDDYMGMKPLDYHWNRNVISYSPKNNQWLTLGSVPYLANCGSSLLSQGPQATLIGGEIKPGLRTAEVKQYNFGKVQPWNSLYALPAIKGETVQEGVAGAFSGMSNGVMIIAGGANFSGARLAFEQGHMFSHKGIAKSYQSEIYVMRDNLWSQSINLPEGLASGLSFTIDAGVLLVGGEDSQREARKDVYLLSWNGDSIEISH